MVFQASIYTKGQSRNDYSLFIKHSGDLVCMDVVNVDDIILTSTDTHAILDLKAHLHSEFGIKDLGTLNYFLGIEVAYLRNGIFLSRKKFAHESLDACDFDLSKKATTHLPPHLKLNASYGGHLDVPELYRSLVGKLNFLISTCLDLAYDVQYLSQFMQTPRTSNLSALIHILRYVFNTIGQGILFCANEQIKLQAFSDSDCVAVDSRKSVTGHIDN